MAEDDKDFDKFISDFSRLYILMILFEGPTHGYGIIDRFRTSIGKEVSPSLVYPFLKSLMEKHYVTMSSHPIGEKERNDYSLTPEGRVFCQKLFKRFAGLVSVAIEPHLDICSHCGTKVFEGGYSETIHGQELKFCCKHCAAAYKQSLET